MEGGDLARRTVDELPLNVAVVDETGEILATNRGWDAFGKAAGRETGDVGENYFAGGSDDEQAMAGIRSVLAGERSIFTHEYPCHTPTERQWFLMRVTRFVEDGDPYAVVAHVDITDRKLAELEVEHLIERVEGLVTEVISTLVSATSREEIETELVETVEAAPKYATAAVCRLDRVRDEIHQTTTGRAALLGGPWPVDGDSPIARAMREQTVETVRSGDGGTGAESLVAVPLASSDTVYGVLVVTSTDGAVFDDRERRLLRSVGRIAGTAIRAVESSTALTATSVVEVELTTESGSPFFTRLSRDLGCALSFRGTVPAEGDGPLVFFEVTDGEPDAVLAWALDDPTVDAATVLWSDGERSLVEFRLAERTLLSRLADRGVETTALDVEDGRGHFTLVFPADRDPREVLAVVEEDHPDAELVAFRERDRPQRTPREIWAAVADDLTPRQRTALTKAYVSGFFDWPRRVTGDDLAESMGITRSTYHQHLRAAEDKVIGAFFEDPN